MAPNRGGKNASFWFLLNKLLLKGIDFFEIYTWYFFENLYLTINKIQAEFDREVMRLFGLEK